MKSVKRTNIPADIQRKLLYATGFCVQLHKETIAHIETLIKIRNKVRLSDKDIGELRQALNFISAHGNQAIEDMAASIQRHESTN